MAIKAKITQIGEKSVKIERLEKGEWTTMNYDANFRVQGNEQTGNVTLTANFAGFDFISLPPDEYEINGQPGTTVSETCEALREFVGNFKGGGGPSEKTRFYTNGIIYFSDGYVPNPRDGKTPDSAFAHTGNMREFFEENVDVFSPKGYAEAVYGFHNQLVFESVNNTTHMELNTETSRYLAGVDTYVVRKGLVTLNALKNQFVEILDCQILRIAHIENCEIKAHRGRWSSTPSPMVLYDIKNSVIFLGAPGAHNYSYINQTLDINLENSVLIFDFFGLMDTYFPPVINLRYGSKLVFQENNETAARNPTTVIHKYDCSQIVWDNRQGKSFAEIYPNVTIINHGGTV